MFDGTAVTPIPLNHKQGPAVVETYFVPWPEDQVWTAMGMIFPGSTLHELCSDFARLMMAPRASRLSTTPASLSPDAGTVITYDQWEDGYETDLTYPTQNYDPGVG